jgi:DNA-binding transcriptional MerR regulator
MIDALAFVESLLINLGQSIRKNIGDSFTGVLKEVLGKYLDFLEMTNALGVNSVQIAGVKKILEGLQISPEDAKSKLDAIEEERKRRRAQIEKDAADAKDKRDKERAAGEGNANDLAKRLQEELEGLIRQAIENAKPQLAKAGLGAIGEGAGNLAPKLPGIDALRSDVKGGFATPLLARQFGIGDTVAKRQLAANEKVAKVAERELPRINAGIKDIAAGLTFK